MRLVRSATCMLLALALLVTASACGSFQAGVPDGLVGLWDCDDYASDGETDTSFYELRIQEDGTFSLYDVAAGNPGISGQMGNDTGNRLECRFDMDDFDAPYCWDLKPSKDTLEYENDADTLRLGHNGVWMTFFRVQDEAESQPIPEDIGDLVSFELPSGFRLEMEYPYIGKEGQPIVQTAYASEREGYFSAAILSYCGYDCISDATRKVVLDEYISHLDRTKQVEVEGTTCYMGTIESDDMPDMVAVAYLPLGDYVFEFRLSNYDEQVTDDQLEAFEEIVRSVRYSD